MTSSQQNWSILSASTPDCSTSARPCSLCQPKCSDRGQVPTARTQKPLGGSAVTISSVHQNLFFFFFSYINTLRYRPVRGRRDHPGKDDIQRDEGRSSLHRKFYIAYDLLSGNIKQFNQPALNHPDSFTLPTNLRSN